MAPRGPKASLLALGASLFQACTGLCLGAACSSSADADEVSALQLAVINWDPSNWTVADGGTLLKSNAAQSEWARAGNALGVLAVDGERVMQVLTNHEDLLYTARIFLGGQVQRAIFDTGSSELLVFSTECTAFDCSFNERLYNSTKSATFKDLHFRRKHSFGSGDVYSRMSLENISVGPMHGEGLFWKAEDAYMPILQEDNFDSIFGLSSPRWGLHAIEQWVEEDSGLLRQCTNTSFGCPKWVLDQNVSDAMYYEKVKAHPAWIEQNNVKRFSFCFGLEPSSNGVFTWNDMNPQDAREGQFKELRVIGQETWSVDLSDVALTNMPRNSGGLGISWCRSQMCHALLDTGTSMLTAPTKVVHVLNKLLARSGNCSNLEGMPELMYNLDGNVIKMPPESYIGILQGDMEPRQQRFFPHLRAKQAERTGCDLLVMAMDLKSSTNALVWIMGMPLFRQYYTTFDLGRSEDYDERSVWISPSDGSCNHPSTKAYRAMVRTRPKLRRLNVSQVRIPGWAERAAERGQLVKL